MSYRLAGTVNCDFVVGILGNFWGEVVTGTMQHGRERKRDSKRGRVEIEPGMRSQDGHQVQRVSAIHRHRPI
jgi:hypothetical protein